MTNCIFCETDTYDKTVERCSDCGLSNVPRTLVDWEIEKLIKMNIIKIYPVLQLEEQLNANGFDLTLDTKFKKLIKSDNIFVDPIEPYNPKKRYQDVELLLSKNEFYVLHPLDFALGQSFEFISIPSFMAAGLDGKSSLGRLSLTIHTTAASIDPGFTGHITFELYNAGGLPLKIHPLQPVARLVFHITEKAKKPYDGAYSRQTEVRPSQSSRSSFSGILLKHTNRLP